jgi:hypothetical protein
VTDYLAQLVLRGRQPDLAIEPRQASRFERPHQTVFAAAPSPPPEPEPAPAEPGTLSQGVTDSRVEGRPRRQHAVAFTAPLEKPTDVVESPAVAHGASDSAGAPVRQERASRTIDAARPIDRVLQPPGTIPERTGRRARRPPDDRVTMRQREQSAPPTSDLPERREHALIADEGDGRPDARRGRTPSVSPAVVTKEVVAPADRTRRAEPVPASRLVERQTTPAPREIERAPASAAPTIHVTIGRVEIRAAAPAPVLKKPSSRQPTLTLEQYLKQRTRGSRE